jgi:hypothetical protein
LTRLRSRRNFRGRIEAMIDDGQREKPPSAKAGGTSRAARRDRLADALKANLARRKAQSRRRADAAAAPSTEPPERR